MGVGGNISDSFSVSQQLACAVNHETGRRLKFSGRTQAATAALVLPLSRKNTTHAAGCGGGKIRRSASMIGEEITHMFRTHFFTFIQAELFAKLRFAQTELPAAFISFVALCNKKQSLRANW